MYVYGVGRGKTKKMPKRRETNALSANICTHAQIKTSTEQKKIQARKLFGKKPTARLLPTLPSQLMHFHFAQTPFVLWQRGKCLHKKVSATMYVFDILNGPVATCQSLFKFAFHIFPLFSRLCFDLPLLSALHSLSLSLLQCMCV